MVLLMSSVTAIIADCDNSIVPELTFRMGGNHLEWPCQATKNIYASSGRYTPKNIIATRAQIYHDTAFVAMPRYRPGVPFTLGKIDLRKGKCAVSISAYPCWASQEEGNCQALQNVVDIYLDRQVGSALECPPNKFCAVFTSFVRLSSIATCRRIWRLISSEEM